MEPLSDGRLSEGLSQADCFSTIGFQLNSHLPVRPRLTSEHPLCAGLYLSVFDLEDEHADPSLRHKVPLQVDIARESHIDVESLRSWRHELLYLLLVVILQGYSPGGANHSILVQLLHLLSDDGHAHLLESQIVQFLNSRHEHCVSFDEAIVRRDAAKAVEAVEPCHAIGLIHCSQKFGLILRQL